MYVTARCRHCGVRREWEKGADGVLRPRKTDGPHGVGHYPYRCESNARDAFVVLCQPIELATPLARQISMDRQYRKSFRK